MVHLNPMLNRSNAQTIKPTEQKQRQTRSDKCQGIRIPVSEDIRRIMQRLADFHGYGNRQTAWNTKVMLIALKNPDEAPSINYMDTGIYMTVKPTQVYFKQIEELRIQWGMSRRRVAHRLLMYAVDRRFRP